MKKIALLLSLTAMSCAGSSLNMEPARQCGHKSLPAEVRQSHAGAGVLEKKWVADRTLRIRTYLYAICEGSTVSGRFRMEGDQITITYSESIGSNPTKCRCAAQYEHDFEDLDRKEYRIVVREED